MHTAFLFFSVIFVSTFIFFGSIIVLAALSGFIRDAFYADLDEDRSFGLLSLCLILVSIPFVWKLLELTSKFSYIDFNAYFASVMNFQSYWLPSIIIGFLFYKFVRMMIVSIIKIAPWKSREYNNDEDLMKYVVTIIFSPPMLIFLLVYFFKYVMKSNLIS